MRRTGARVKERARAWPSTSRSESPPVRAVLLLAAAAAILRTHGPSLPFVHGPLPSTLQASADPKVRLAAKKRSSSSKANAPVFDNLKVGSLVRGVVQPTKAYQGCFMDIGTEAWARLDIPRNIFLLERRGKLRNGTEYEVRISSLDPSNGHVNLKFKDHDAMLSQWEADRKPISAYKVGDSVDGVAVQITTAKVFLDIGCTQLAKLTGSTQVRSKVRMSEEFKNLIVESADSTKGTIKVALSEDSAEEIASRRQPRPDPKTETSSSIPDLVPVLKRSKSMAGNNFTLSVRVGANTQQRLRLSLEGLRISGVDTRRNRLRISAMTPDGQNDGETDLRIGSFADGRIRDVETFSPFIRGDSSLTPLQMDASKESLEVQADNKTDLQVGDRVDGRVRNVHKFGTFIRVEGCPTPVKLNASKEIQARLRFGEELRGLRVTEVHGNRPIVALPKQILMEIASRTDEKLSLEEAQVGSVIHGHVATVSRIGIFVDVGYEVPAILMDWKKQRFASGQLLRNLRISKVDLERRKLQVRL